MEIMRCVRRAAAFVALAGLLQPLVAALLLTAHLAAQHEGHADERDATGLTALWHGHSHDADTPEHDHPLLTTRVARTAAAPPAHVAFAWTPSSVLADACAAVACVDHRSRGAPRASSQTHSILRI
jgi:hypothetical protein